MSVAELVKEAIALGMPEQWVLDLLKKIGERATTAIVTFLKYWGVVEGVADCDHCSCMCCELGEAIAASCRGQNAAAEKHILRALKHCCKTDDCPPRAGVSAS